MNSVEKHMLLTYLSDIANQYESHKFLRKAVVNSYIDNVERLENLVSSQKKSKPIKILDWGCGKGQITYILSKGNYHVTSCDLDSGLSDSSFSQSTPIIEKNNFSVIPLKHDFLLPFEDETFDVVTSFGVLEHVNDDVASLKEIKRILKAGGIFYFCMLPTNYSWTQRLAHLLGDFYHSRLYSKSSVETLVRVNKFKDFHLSYEHFFPKNRWKYNKFIDKFDKFICSTPLKVFATNFYGYFIK
jgi:SAM-dependent methyltransferase